MRLCILTILLLTPLGGANAASPDPRHAANGVFDIREFGASSRADVVNTKPIQGAIDTCTNSGGGVVLVTGGRFVTGTLYLKDNVTLRIEAGAALLGSTSTDDYTTDTHKNAYANESHMDRCLLFAHKARNIAIEGRGAIDGQGSKEHFPTDGSPRPMLLRFLECENLRVHDVNLLNPAAWTSAWLYCKDIVVSGVRIESRVNWNGDGLDFDGCQNVRVYGCSFDTSDDSICLQASRAESPCKDITISDCIFVSKWAGMRIGLLSVGDFENVSVSNCVFRDISDAGLKIQMCEGGTMRNMVFSGLVMQRVPRPVFMTFNRFRLGVDTPQDTPPMKSMGHMQFSNICVDNTELAWVPCGFVLSGTPGHFIEDIRFHNISLRLPGDASSSEAGDVRLPTFVDQRPEFAVLGEKIPFAGFYARQVRHLTLSDFRFDTANPEARPVIMCDDVDGLTVGRMEYGNAFTAQKKVRLIDVKDSKMTDD